MSKRILDLMRANSAKFLSDILSAFFLIALLFTCVILSNLIYMDASAEQKIIEVNRYTEELTISTNQLKSVDLDFIKGKELEVIFTVNVKDNYQIDVWFLNDENYYLMANGAQYLFYIDGSAKKVPYMKRIVVLEDNGIYNLVFHNCWANKTVQVNLEYELRVLLDKPKDKDYFLRDMYFSFIIMLVLTSAFLYVLIKNRKRNRKNANVYNKPKKHKTRGKSFGKKSHHNSGIRKSSKTKEKVKKINKKKELILSKEPVDSIKYCGFCGKEVNTPFCINCGKEVGK